MMREKISNIISQMNKNDNYCQGASQQMANGFYRIYDTLEVICLELDENNTQLSRLKTIRSTLDTNNSYCQGAPQQCANGVYRIVEILEVLIALLEDSGRYNENITTIFNVLNKNNSYCQGAPQQTANGAYRIIEMLDIVTNIVAPEKGSAVSANISEMNRINNMCQGAPQQSANGTDCAFIITQHIVYALDTKGKYSSNLSSIASLKSRNNSCCQGADQQSANNLYRIMDTLQVLGYIMDDQIQEKIEKYWEEHSEEKTALLNEKKECQNKIDEIKREANAINANDEINPLRKEWTDLSYKKNECGRKELAELQRVIEQRKEERSEIGFFKFSLRKEAAAKIEGAKAEYYKKEQEINGQKNKIQKEMDVFQGKIDKLEANVKKKKDAVLKTANPYQDRINAIDHELTRRR